MQNIMNDINNTMQLTYKLKYYLPQMVETRSILTA